jgi:hypothetical protein
MKQLTRLLASMAMLSMASLVRAQQEVETDQDGAVWVVDRHLLSDDTEEKQAAYNDPGTEVPIGTFQVRFQKTGFFHYVLVREYSEVVLFEGDHLKTIQKVVKKRGEKQFAIHVVVLLLAMLFMAVSNVATKMNKWRIVIVFAILAVLGNCGTNIISIVLGDLTVALAYALVCALASAIACVFAFPLAKIAIYWICSIAFYASECLVLFLWFVRST